MTNEKNKTLVKVILKAFILLILVASVCGLFILSYQSLGILLNNKVNSLNENWLSFFYYASFSFITCISFFFIKLLKNLVIDCQKMKRTYEKTETKKMGFLHKNKAYSILSYAILIVLIVILSYFTTTFMKNIVVNKIDVFVNYTYLILIFVFLSLITCFLFLLMNIIINKLKTLNNESNYTFDNSGFTVVCIIVGFVIGVLICFINMKMYHKIYPSLSGEFDINETNSLITYSLLTILVTMLFNSLGYLVYRFILNMVKINSEELGK